MNIEEMELALHPVKPDLKTIITAYRKIMEEAPSSAEAEAAKIEPLDLQPLRFDMQAPHFVIWVQQILEQKYGADVLYRSGLQVFTTLDSEMQAIAQQEAQAHLATLTDRRATNAGALWVCREVVSFHQDFGRPACTSSTIGVVIGVP